MPRIISGAGKGRVLKSPKGHDTRPTGGRVRQTLFDILAPRMHGCRFLDAFAGTGAVGLEAASRGAARVVMVDQSRPAIQAIQANMDALGTDGSVRVLKQDTQAALLALAAAGEQFDVVFVDPPYDSPLYEPVIERVGSRLLAPDGVVIAEHFHKRVLPERIGRLACTRAVRVGDHRLSFFTPHATEDYDR